MANAAESLAREVSDLRRRLAALERSGQISRSTVPGEDGTPVPLAEGVRAGMAAGAQAAEAIEAAASALAKADGAVESFFGASEPEGGKVGDFWRKPTGEVLQHDGTSWEAIADPEVRADLDAALGRLADTEGALDGKVSTFFAPLLDPPNAAAVGDLWIVSDAGNLLRRWSGKQWVDARDAGIEQAAADAAAAKTEASGAAEAAAAAQETADSATSASDLAKKAADDAAKAAADAATLAQTAEDQAASAAGIAGGKADVLIQSTAPAAEYRKASTLWIDTTSSANTPKRWTTGTTWVAVTDKKAADAATAASNAAKAATTAQSAADSAASVAAQAVSDAASALSRADDAHSLAGTAEGNAQAAITSAAGAATAASNAATAAKTAQTAANAAPKNLFSTANPSGTAPKGSTWFKVNSSGQVIGQWQQTATGTASTWTKRDIRSDIIANLDVGKLTAGTTVVNEAVAKKLIADVVEAYTITAPTIQTGSSGSRVVMDKDGLTAYGEGQWIPYASPEGTPGTDFKTRATLTNRHHVLSSTATDLWPGLYFMADSAESEALWPTAITSDTAGAEGLSMTTKRQTPGDAFGQIRMTPRWMQIDQQETVNPNLATTGFRPRSELFQSAYGWGLSSIDSLGRTVGITHDGSGTIHLMTPPTGKVVIDGVPMTDTGWVRATMMGTWAHRTAYGWNGVSWRAFNGVFTIMGSTTKPTAWITGEVMAQIPKEYMPPFRVMGNNAYADVATGTIQPENPGVANGSLNFSVSWPYTTKI